MSDKNIDKINVIIPLRNDEQNVSLTILIKNIHSIKISFSTFERIEDDY